jgi:rRNA-processing protein FCF1
MMPVELDVRLFDELDRLLGAFEPVTPQAVVEELRRLSEKGGEEGIAASVGHDLATERCLIVDTDESYADDALVELAREGHADYVVTNDLPLRDRVLDAGVPVIALRGRNKLAITQP